MGVTRTSEPLTVSDGELDRAIAVVEELLREEGLEVDIDVSVDEDPEDSSVTTVTIMRARLPASFDPTGAVPLMTRCWDRLREHSLGYPERPLLFGVDLPPDGSE